MPNSILTISIAIKNATLSKTITNATLSIKMTNATLSINPTQHSDILNNNTELINGNISGLYNKHITIVNDYGKLCHTLGHHYRCVAYNSRAIILISLESSITIIIVYIVQSVNNLSKGVVS